MSASRDQNQKVAFVYSNLYQIYQKGKTAAQNAPDAPVVVPATPSSSSSGNSGNVLKAEDLHASSSQQGAPKVSSYNPAELIGKRFARPASLPPASPVGSHAPKYAIVSLKDNLKALNDLHSRLRFMLQELEDLVRE